ncbi:GntR family transcriptional regulator [Clostridium tarantellae]|uniref:UTRA domain-containing protein n=1 Tax=Clostridium tarantellae TaxID=39493 RepID=A0A6I1MRI3_9CLOT|nr:GntR family transcriptional regulator [Clostridium tarantellae]MPQ44807.1 UTRA domain-containing protein [Clostridium tarantellae]
MLDKNSNEPLHLQLYKVIKENIQNKTFIEGEKLPSENDFKETYNVSRSTVRQALSKLEQECLIFKEKRKGSFVSYHSVNQNLDNFYSFSKELKNLGKTPKYKLICFDKITPDDNIKNIMHLNKNEQVFKIDIVRKMEDEPVLFETTYLPAKRFNEFEKIDLNTNALYDVLQDNYNVKFTDAIQTFYPVLPDKTKKHLLAINSKDTIACMGVERISYENNLIVEYTKAVVKGNKFKYQIRLKNNDVPLI